MSYFKDSMTHRSKLIQFFLKKEDWERVAEPVYQLLRDFYFHLKRELPKKSITVLSKTLGLKFDNTETATLTLIEQNVRQEKRYIESCSKLNKETMQSILNKIQYRIQSDL